MTHHTTAAVPRTQSAEERAWNEAHGLTACCTICGGAMREDGREFRSHACYYRYCSAENLAPGETVAQT